MPPPPCCQERCPAPALIQKWGALLCAWRLLHRSNSRRGPLVRVCTQCAGGHSGELGHAAGQRRLRPCVGGQRGRVGQRAVRQVPRVGDAGRGWVRARHVARRVCVPGRKPGGDRRRAARVRPEPGTYSGARPCVRTACTRCASRSTSVDLWLPCGRAVPFVLSPPSVVFVWFVLRRGALWRPAPTRPDPFHTFCPSRTPT